MVARARSVGLKFEYDVARRSTSSRRVVDDAPSFP